MNETPDHVRIFMVDQTSFDAILTVPWDVLCNMLLTHGCLVTSTAFINRSSIIRMVRFRPGMTEGVYILCKHGSFAVGCSH